MEYLEGIGCIGIYFAVCASAALTLRLTIRIPDEVFRKLLHCILLGSLSVWVAVYDVWWMAATSSLLFAAVVYPLLWLLEHVKGYSRVVTERKRGELKRSLIVVFVMFAAVVAVCWGCLGDRWLVLASIYAWGFGDALAALIGKRYGRHGLYGRKTIEGTAAMFVTSFVSVTAVLLIRGRLCATSVLSGPACLVTALVTAAVSALTELFTPDGMDTMTCPLAAMAVLIPLVQVLGG